MSEGIANADESEIRLTPEMIEAGALALARFSTYVSTLEDEAERVFREIMKAAPGKGFIVRRSAE